MDLDAEITVNSHRILRKIFKPFGKAYSNSLNMQFAPLNEVEMRNGAEMSKEVTFLFSHMFSVQAICF